MLWAKRVFVFENRSISGEGTGMASIYNTDQTTDHMVPGLALGCFKAIKVINTAEIVLVLLKQ